jgi:hypothetical protein
MMPAAKFHSPGIYSTAESEQCPLDYGGHEAKLPGSLDQRLDREFEVTGVVF